MSSNTITSNHHMIRLFKVLYYSRLPSFKFRSTKRHLGNGEKLTYSTAIKQTDKSSSILTPSSLAGRYSNFIGRVYEKHSMKCMKEVLLFKDLVHVGKKASQDGGIDIKGWLYLDRRSRIKNPPEFSDEEKRPGLDEFNNENQGRFIKAIAQCKCSRAELRLVRELEGLVGTSSTHRGSLLSKPILGVLFSSQGFTPPSLTQAEKSPFPLILVTLDFPSALLSISEDIHLGVLPDEDDCNLYPPCRISHCYPNPIAVQLIRPFEFIRVSKLTTDGLPAQHSWILVCNEQDEMIHKKTTGDN